MTWDRYNRLHAAGPVIRAGVMFFLPFSYYETAIENGGWIMKNTEGSVKILFLKKKWWTAAVCLCLAAVMFCVVNYPAAIGAAAPTRQLPIYCVQRDQKLVSVSFDAAWGDVILRQGLEESIASEK